MRKASVRCHCLPSKARQGSAALRYDRFMRCVLALAILVSFSTSVRANDELVHTRAVLQRHADAAHRTRAIAGITMIAAGTAVGLAGYHMATNVHEGGLVDLSDLERAYGYSFVAVGGLAAINGTILLLRTTEYERMAEEVTGAQDARFARTEIAHKAATGRRTRMIVRGMGLTLAGIGALGATIALAGDDRISRDMHNTLLGSGIAFGIFGAGFVVGSLIETRWEGMHDDLQVRRTPVTAGLVPVRGGAVLGLGGSF